MCSDRKAARGGRGADSLTEPCGADSAELKKRTLTNLYNARPTWLANLHAALDRADYGWEDDPCVTTDEAILERLLALNEQRATSNEQRAMSNE